MSRADNIENIIASNIEEMVAEAAGDPEALLRLASRELRYAEEYQRRVALIRDETAAVLRDAGVTMTRIARLAGRSDSYMSRRLIRLGSARRVVRAVLPERLGDRVGSGEVIIVSEVPPGMTPVTKAPRSSPEGTDR